MKKIAAAVVAHVDAGKTTLSEALLYTTGMIRKLGRVDQKDCCLDTDEQERARGITIFSKQVNITTDALEVTLLDTPGHVDFSAEMERTLQVLDYAVLVIGGMDGVQGHTRTLWRLLERYEIPVFLFVNKMDQPGADKGKILEELRCELSDGCVDFSAGNQELHENAALCEEALLNSFLETGRIEDHEIQRLIAQRKLFPVYFGSALHLDGVDAFWKGMELYVVQPIYKEDFGARVFKILRDRQGERLTYMKITGGKLKVKSTLGEKQEKVNQIRLYSSEKYKVTEEAFAGQICAVTGLTETFPGQGFGMESSVITPVLEPVLTYRVILPEDQEPMAFLPKLRELEEEEPQLHIVWDEELREIQAKVMGEVQIEILQNLIRERYGVSVEFGTGSIVYKETIASCVEGVGHFEPLRHYAEVHLILEPLEAGSGMQYEMDCSEDVLAKNWQRLILTHLEEREHRGVLTGSALTDVKITVAAGRAHQKHTEGGDFRQATYRAVRQGLMQAECVLLEPYYRFVLEVPADSVGRAMTDLEQRGAQMELPENKDGLTVLQGRAPVVTMRDYPREVIAYTRGNGRISCVLDGYAPCHNAEEVIEKKGYDPEMDLSNPSCSVFCSHGSGFYVPWDKVPEYMHVESVLSQRQEEEAYWQEEADRLKQYAVRRQENQSEEEWIGTDEIDQILHRTYHANRKEEFVPHKGISHVTRKPAMTGTIVREFNKKPQEKREKYLLVDGYNVIYAWEELAQLAEVNMGSARGKLLDTMCDYQAMKKCSLIVVFDAYRVPGHITECMDYHNIHVVFTKEAETADQYIEKFAHEHGRKYDVTVATSDGLEQVIIRGQGCALLSSRELEKDVLFMKQKVKEEYLEQQKTHRGTIYDGLSEQSKKEIDKLL